MLKSTPMVAAMSRPSARTGLLAAAGTVCLVWLLCFAAPNHEQWTSKTMSLKTAALDRIRNTIPNQVHYVHIMPDIHDEITFKFKHFLSVYSASLYFQPDAIYIHTDASEESLQRAKQGPRDTVNKWAYSILNLPGVVIRHVEAPTHTKDSGIKLKGLEHQSDFVRTQVVFEMGGMYIDWDVHAIRDVEPLRESGFANVLGRQMGGEVNSGCYMARKGSALMKLWMDNEHVVYNGRWTTHSNGLITSLSEKLTPIPKEVLILDQKAMAPGSWAVDDMTILFQSHFDYKPSDEETDSSNMTDPDALWAAATTKEPWQVDYSSSYVLHAFHPKRGRMVENFTEITMEYVLARQSNFALVLYPAVKHALQAGIIFEKD